jgi:hypothetical protein
MDHPTTDTVNRCETIADCAYGKRNRYFRRKRMDAAEFRAEQDYFLERRRLINRTVHGWGVVAGYQLDGPRPAAAPPAHAEPAPKPEPVLGLRIGAGLAFDRRGRELLLCEATTISQRNTFLFNPAGGPRSLKDAKAGSYLLRVHYAERATGDSMVASACGCGDVEKDFTCETIVFSVEPLGCDNKCPCAEQDCERVCKCGAGACGESGRGPHACLCQWSAATAVDCASSPPLCGWKGLSIDPGAGVGLACITLERSPDPCEPIVVKTIDDDCGPRRLVKSNDMLYDLARGCDLTHIESISWGQWHRNPEVMPWETFLDFLRPGTVDRQKEAALTSFSVRFSGPVQTETVTPDCFALWFVVNHPDSGWFERRVVAIRDVHRAEPTNGDPDRTTREVRLKVDRGWHSEVINIASKFRTEGATVQIEVHGDYILDCHGQPVDGNAHGFALRDFADGKPTKPSGNGTPGGTFLSVFRIDKRSADPA